MCSPKTKQVSRKIAGWVYMFLWALGVPCAANPGADPAYERWYAIYFRDQRAGWSHESMVESHEPPTITTTTRMKMTIDRGGMALSVSISHVFIETPDGKPIESRYEQDLGAMKVAKTTRFKQGRLEVTTTQGGRDQIQQLPYPKTADGSPWLPPAAAQRHIAARVHAGAQTIEYWTIEPSMGTNPLKITMKRRGQENVEIIGKWVPTIAWDTTSSATPGIVSREYTDPRGHHVKSVLSFMPGMDLTVIQADRNLATAEVDPVELMASTLLRPDRPIAQPRKTRSARYELVFNIDPPKPVDDQASQPIAGKPNPAKQTAANPLSGGRPQIVHGGYQRIQWKDPQTLTVTVDLRQPVDGDPVERDHLQSSAMLDHRDPAIRALTQQALSDESATALPQHKAETLRRFVHRYVNAKDLSVGLATATEVAHTRQGDCTEHAVLLAAMLRAAEIPSRTVTGLIYVDQFLGKTGVFGYHMWTQAWLSDSNGRGRWVDLDATLPEHPFDAAHIALSASAMTDDTMLNDLVAMAQVLGRIKIRVIEVETGGSGPSSKQGRPR